MITAISKKPIQRQLSDFARDVPEGDIDATDGMHNDAPAAMLARALEHLLPQVLDEEWVLPY